MNGHPCSKIDLAPDFQGPCSENPGKIHGKYLEIRVFGTKLDICNAQNTQKNHRKPAVTTRGSFDGPKGPQEMTEMCRFFFLFLTDSTFIFLEPLVDPRTGSPVRLATRSAQRPSARAVVVPCLLPSLLPSLPLMNTPARAGRPGRRPSVRLIELRETPKKPNSITRKPCWRPGGLLGASGCSWGLTGTTPGGLSTGTRRPKSTLHRKSWENPRKI